MLSQHGLVLKSGGPPVSFSDQFKNDFSLSLIVSKLPGAIRLCSKPM